MNYTEYVTALASLMVVQPTSPDFVAILPSIISYADNRIWRELDLLAAVAQGYDPNWYVDSSDNEFTFHSQDWITLNSVGIFTPPGTSIHSGGTLVNLTPVSIDYLNMAWGSLLSQGVPQVFARITDTKLIVGPTPDAKYFLYFIGTKRVDTFNTNDRNSTTYLSLYLPDLYLAASMVFASGYQKNFGSQADDPKMSASWEQQYQTLKDSAAVEDFKKRYQSNAWGPMKVPTIATPPRV